METCDVTFQPPESGTGEVGYKRETSKCTSNSDWMERHVFSAIDKGVRTVASHMIALPAAGMTVTSN
jgi:hypothetical protein